MLRVPRAPRTADCRHRNPTSRARLPVAVTEFPEQALLSFLDDSWRIDLIDEDTRRSPLPRLRGRARDQAVKETMAQAGLAHIAQSIKQQLRNRSPSNGASNHEIERMWTIFFGLRDPSPARTCGNGAKSTALDRGTICSMRAPVAICQAGGEHPSPQATCCASGRLKVVRECARENDTAIPPADAPATLSTIIRRSRSLPTACKSEK